ncbi:unnamed protein product [Arctia plantaginis]|uniref:Amine oxidase domain-containing protein n=1 Tax=Arctia plantaginis TaxID=874455 RepID=A0A8S1AA04_ARCPL|nr:unnamed protein product [Arctia plantaginis]CAB3253861.1 unnamed protein product [Arctia plantaginis]
MDVIVIGCGAAGVAAMRKLHDAGLQVLGLEAAERIGGRVCSVEFGDKFIDIGAAWCHGEKDNKVFELANPLDLLGRPAPDNKFYLLSDGKTVAADIAEEILAALDDEVAKADKYNSRTISECVRQAQHTNEIFKRNPKLSRSFVEFFERNNHLGGQNDAKTGKSLRGLIEVWNSEGEFMLNWKGRGYKTILDVLLNKVPDPTKEIPLKILLNKEVENIRWGTNHRGLDNPLVQVTCKDGSLYAAKSVIVTLSVGVLKERYANLFNPPLPVEKVKSLQNLEMCILDKIYIEFEKPWWPESPANFTLLWRDEDKAKFSAGDKWVTEIYGLLSVDYHPNVLLAWIYGNGAELMEKLSEEEVKAGVQKLIDTVLKKQFDVTPIKRILRSQWALNPLARGSYAHRTAILEENGGSAITLSEPLYRSNRFPVVCFAGEATSHHRHTAVHGAIESGFREAERLIESFQRLV